MIDSTLHKTQVSILHSLRYARSERFSVLMHPTGHASDTFKFHLRKLVAQGYVTKRPDGAYQLTAAGKEYANSLNEPQRTVQKQPKLSILMVISRPTAMGDIAYLLQKRSRSPHYGYWGEIHGRAVWGEPFETTAQHQLARQTGLSADFTVHSFRRVRDYDRTNGTMLEDKLFVILTASNVSGALTHTYPGGTNAWLTLDELRRQDKVFVSTIQILENLLHGDEVYTTQDILYDPEDY